MTETQLLLTILGEECNEVGQRCSKAIRFGLDEIQTGQGQNNADRLIQEFNDLTAVMKLLCDMKILDGSKCFNVSAMNEKIEKVKKYNEYSKSLGIVN